MTMKHSKASKQNNEIMKISESYLCKTNSCYAWTSAIKLRVYMLLKLKVPKLFEFN